MIERLGIRQAIELREENLSPFAAKSRRSRGRARPEEPCPVRTAFQQDRDRIIHAKSFRRLKHKTQVFIAPPGDHFATRLTHTLVVSQVARTVARALNLNEDLTEAITLGHDLGHTPFGHIGEDALNELFPTGFHHNEQSLRTVEILENNGQGLNLTWEVRDGILNHSKSRSSVLGEGWGPVGTLEGEIGKIADMVAYINHDTEDAVRAGILTEADLPQEALAVLGRTYSERINTLVCDIICQSWGALGKASNAKPVIAMSPRVLEATNRLRDFLFHRVYTPQARETESQKARQIIRSLYVYFMGHAAEMPPEYREGPEPETARHVVDYISGMTDQYALKTTIRLFPDETSFLMRTPPCLPD
jgi:dGTPase